MTNPSRPLKPKQIESLNSAKVGTAIKWMSKAQTWIFKSTHGKLGNKFLKGSEVGILTTIGRKSGEPRDSPLLFLQEGKRIVLVASQGGRATNPMWYLNLVANPRITFRVTSSNFWSSIEMPAQAFPFSVIYCLRMGTAPTIFPWPSPMAVTFTSMPSMNC